MNNQAIKIKRALISCWDKSGLLDIVTKLKASGVEIISSGGTAAYLSENNIPVTKVEEITRFKEILDGRVKTLHPMIHGAILAKRTPDHLQQLKDLQMEPFDLVLVNLYPFVEAVGESLSQSEMIELIDIGGPAMLRAAAKNYEQVVALHHPDQYQPFLDLWKKNEHSIPVNESMKYAKEAFFYTSFYDSQIFQYLENIENSNNIPDRVAQFYRKSHDLRYGENPHQSAAYYKSLSPEKGLDSDLQQLWGKEMSYNNYVDVASAMSLVKEFNAHTVAIIKHTNPCGLAMASSLPEAFERARAGDPLSAFGGIVACNEVVNPETAQMIKETFFECIIAPDYDQESLDILSQKKNLRILKYPSGEFSDLSFELKLLGIGLLVQKPDQGTFDPEKIKSVGYRKPSDDEEKDLYFAWAVAKHVKSNAIVFVKNLQVIGVGAGQMSRIDSVRIAKQKAETFGHDIKGAVMASDAFFPFRDGIDEAAEVGISAVIQPGGSIRDEEVIQAIQEHQMAMLLTQIRHFKH
ncbi:MAG: bifunctional phosphoribosylaminoimidazolecarboxamide formyltransferase/IMP cyclohydrolase [Calditrichia bacterium]|nr:bifunctional phosphoribosylaminoimidazolecarboxamide formyltransferase/IMP cyclohydrolase [Calditrichia bacterium]